MCALNKHNDIWGPHLYTQVTAGSSFLWASCLVLAMERAHNTCFESARLCLLYTASTVDSTQTTRNTCDVQFLKLAGGRWQAGDVYRSRLYSRETGALVRDATSGFPTYSNRVVSLRAL